MNGFDKWLIRAAAIAVLAWFGWQLASATALTIINQQIAIGRLQQQIQQQAEAKK